MRSINRAVLDRHWPRVERALPWLLMGLGAVLRLAQYFHNRSFWLDECFLAIASVDKPLAELLQPLPLNQAAPVGYLCLQKAAVSAWGPSEYVLRLISLVAGLASLPLFWMVARRFVGGTALWWALGLFATSDYLIYYSSEAKQYSSDMAVALCCYLVAERLGAKLTTRRLLGVALSGALLVWLSHPAVFVLSGIALSYGLDLIARGEWKRLGRHCLAYAAWAASFATLYYLHLANASANSFLHKYWSFAYMPLGGFPAAQALWFMRMSAGVFSMLTLSWEPVPAMIAGVGAVVLWRRSPVRSMSLTFPMLAALIAAGLHRYPFNGRLILFLAPSLILLLAATLEAIMRRNMVLGGVLAALLLLHPAECALDHLIHPRERANTRAAVAYLMRNVRDGDVVYAGWEAQFHVDYYTRLLGTHFERYVRGRQLRDGTGPFFGALDSLRGNRRVWVLLSSVLDWDPAATPEVDPEEAKALNYLNASGSLLASFRTRGAAVFLYDLSGTPRPRAGPERSRRGEPPPPTGPPQHPGATAGPSQTGPPDDRQR